MLNQPVSFFQCIKEEPWFPLKEEFSFIGSAEEDKRVRGTAPPSKKEDCEASVSTF